VSDEPRPIAESLSSMLRAMRGVDAAAMGGVFGTWDEAVGPAVAAHARPVRLDEGVLTVRVDDPSWATQMRLLEHDVRARVKAACGVDLVRVEVRVERTDRRR